MEHFYVLRAVEEADWKSFEPNRHDDWIDEQVVQLERSIGIPIDLGMDAAIYVTDLLHLNLLKGVIAWDGTFVLNDPDDKTTGVSKPKAVTWRGEEVLKYLWPELYLIR